MKNGRTSKNGLNTIKQSAIVKYNIAINILTLLGATLEGGGMLIAIHKKRDERLITKSSRSKEVLKIRGELLANAWGEGGRGGCSLKRRAPSLW